MSKDAITIILPVGRLDSRFHRQHVNLQLSLQEAQTLAAIMTGLSDNNAILDPGVPGEARRDVKPGNGNDAIRWILQAVRREITAPQNR